MATTEPFQLSAFSPGTMLWRAAKSSGDLIALQGPGRQVTYRQLAQEMLRATHTTAGAWQPSAADLTVDAALDACKAFGAGAMLECAEGGVIAHPTAIRPATSPFTINAVPLDALAMFRKLSPSEGIGWSSEAMSFAWGVAAQTAGTVSLLSSDVGSLISWPALYGVLLARGRVVIAGSVGSEEWTTALKNGGITSLDLAREDVSQLLDTSCEPVLSVQKIRVWGRGIVDWETMAQLQKIFVNARVSRAVYWDGGVVGVATADALRKYGANYLGRAPLGTRYALDESGEILIADSFYQPSRVTSENDWQALGAVCRHTGLHARLHTDEQTLLMLME